MPTRYHKVSHDPAAIVAKLRRSKTDASAGAVEEIARIVARIRRGWPKTRIPLRGDSGFAREALIAWMPTRRIARSV